MSGTKEGSKKAVQTIYQKHGLDFFRLVGKEGGKSRNPNKGFGGDRDRARIEGAKGGAISRRGPAEVNKKERIAS